MFSRDVGIDLGTANVIVFLRGKGIVIREPSVVAIEQESKRILAVGEEARQMIGRTPGNIVAIRPLKDGVIADYEVTETMLKHFIVKACGKPLLLRPQMVVCVPSRVTSVEKRAVLEACMQAGAKRVLLISEPMAAALGAGLNVAEPHGKMVVDIGGGTTDVAVISLGGEVVADSLRLGGDKFDEAIVQFVKREHNLLIGERTAEEAKIQVATACGSRSTSMDIRGRDLMSGLPKNVTLTSEECQTALREPVSAIAESIKEVLEQTPPELTADIIEHGICMTGGGSLLHGLDKLIAETAGVPAYLADDPVSCVALGTGRALENFETFEDHLVVLKKVM